MNRRQRDANRKTAREARHLLHGSPLRFTAMAGGGSMAVISSRNLRRGSALRPTLVCFDDVEDVPPLPPADLTEGARRILLGIDPEQDPPVLVEGESDLTKVMGHFTRGPTSGPVFFCVDDLDCSAPAAVEKAPEFATALDRIWVSQSVLSPIRYIDEPAKEAT